MSNQNFRGAFTTVRQDARAKVTGAEKYASDYYAENMLWTGAKRANIPHGKILALDTSKAAALPGVYAVLTAKDVPGSNRQGIIHKDQPVLVDEKVLHCGDALALVLAEDKATLRQALSLIYANIEELPGVFTVQEALAPLAPKLHERGNILLKAKIEKGRAQEELKRCPIVVEDSFAVPIQAHGYLELENGLAQLQPDGKLVITVSSQAPFRDRLEIAHALGLNPLQVRVISPYLGGGFGGKDGATVQCLLALAALKANGRPVKMCWEREESFRCAPKRHAVDMHYRLGANLDGTLQALACELYYDTGAYAHLGAEVMELGMEHAAGPYRLPHALIEGHCVHTNNPIAGAMRGFGVCQVSFAFERMMDRLAAALNIDPLEFRLKNALRQGDENCCGVKMTHSTNLVACLEQLKRHPAWQTREKWKKQTTSFKRRGVAVSAVFNAMGYGRGLADAALAKIELTSSGKFRVYNGVADMGQGNSSTFVQMAADLLGQDVSRIEIVQPDTERCLPSGSSSAGRTTYTFGNALIKACQQLKEKLSHWASMLLLVDEPSTFTLINGALFHPASKKEISLEKLAQLLPPAELICSSQFTMPVAQDVPNTGKEFLVGFPHAIFGYAAHLAAVEVDELTGQLEVKQYVAITDGGQVLNKQVFEQQVQGAVAQGLGYALMEEMQVKQGQTLNPDFTNYLMPTTLDIPEVQCLAVESCEDSGPGGMKGIGEVGINAALPVVAAAVEDATNKHLHRSPFTPARVWQALQEDNS